MKLQVLDEQHYISNGNGVWTPFISLHRNALLLSEPHQRIDGVYKSGGPFFTRQYHTTIDLHEINWKLNNVVWHGTPFVGWGAPGFPGDWDRPSDGFKSELTTGLANAFSYGATGWKRARPGNPTAGLATFVGELKEGLPRMPHLVYARLKTLLSRKTTAKRLGYVGSDEYLNVTMGWIPLLSDIRKMYKTYRDLDRKLAQIVRENGKGIHRKRIIKDSTESTSTTNDYTTPFGGWGYAPPYWVPGHSRTTVVYTTIEKVWFVGKFRYYIPDVGTSQWKRRTTTALFGAKITPDAVYQLLPWSWLFDWFGNMGDVMSNMSSNAVENETCDYAYVMRTTEQRSDVYASTSWSGLEESSFGFSSLIPAGSASVHAYDSYVTKTRVAGSPFGFGIHYDGLSPYQVGVAAALGIKPWASS